jgi:5-hydroxyisourate hydrolase-like protein (transthyretin family)
MIMENYDITKQNGNIAFSEDAHVYWDVTDPSKKFISVTTLIEKFGQPFDKDFWSAYKALEKLLPKDVWTVEKKSLLATKKFDPAILSLHEIAENDFNREQQAILDSWDAENKKSCERGTKIHADLENSFYKKKKNIDISKYQIGGTFECKKDYTDLDLENAVYPEYLIHRVTPDGKLCIAGQIDLLVKKGNHIIIGDWKGLPLDTEIPTLEGWSTIAELKEGDTIFDKEGKPTKIVHKSEIHMNPCYKITFDNGDSIIADHEHKWEINFKKNKNRAHPDGMYSCIMTTEEIFNYLNSLEQRRSDLIPKILNPKPLDLPDKHLLIDPYVLGVWLGDGSKVAGIITQMKGSPVWAEIERRGYTLGENAQHNPDRENVEMRTVYGLRTLLKAMNLLNNKFIPDDYQRASFKQRLDLLRGLMDTDGYYNASRKRYIMSTGQEWQRDDLVKLLASLGIKSTVFAITKKCGGKKFQAWDVCFSTSEFNPFLTRNQDINVNESEQNNRTFRNLDKVELVETVQTQCLEVDSPTHTFLCTNKMIVTHNTNKKIETKSYFDSKTKSSVKMKYPLNNLDECNYSHYNLQLSTYAWMIQKLNPDFIIDDLVLVHFDHNDNMTVYHMPYLKTEVEKMLAFYKKQSQLEESARKRKRIEY